MPYDSELIEHIARLLEEKPALDPEIRDVLERAAEQSKKPDAPNYDEIVEIIKILLTFLSLEWQLHHQI